MSKLPLGVQASALPTRKLLAFAVTNAFTVTALELAQDLTAAYPATAFLADDTWQTLIPIAVGFGVAYMFKDRLNLSEKRS